MKVSFFVELKDVEPVLREMSFKDLVDALSPHEVATSKDGLPCYTPAEYPPEDTRRKNNVTRVHFGCLDFDGEKKRGLTQEQMSLVESKLDGYEHCIYTTWSHHMVAEDNRFKVRVMFPFSRPVEAKEWPVIFPRLMAMFDNLGDKSCSDTSRLYFIPSHPEGQEESALIHYEPGRPLDVTKLLRESRVNTPAPVSSEEIPLTLEEVLVWMRSLKQKLGSLHFRWLHAKLALLVQGKSLAQEGFRDEVVFKMAMAIVEQFPMVTPESVGEIFRDSLDVMAKEGPDAPTFELVVDKVQRHKDKVREDEAEELTSELQQHLERLELVGRESPYSAEELSEFGDMRRRWVVQKDQSFYVFCNGDYRGPYTHKEISNKAVDLLSPATSAGLDVFVTMKTGGRRVMTPDELVYNFGQVAEGIRVDMTAQESRFEGGNIIEAPCPKLITEARFSPVVDRWLRLMSGSSHNKVLDWLSVVTKLDQPCAAIYWDGPKGSGKSLFADAVARIWTRDGAVPLEDVFGVNHNSMILKCPIIFGDESVPKDFGGRINTGKLRQFIQARNRTLKRKFIADAQVMGCARLVLAANNRDLLSSNEHLTVNDIEAITDRILYVRVPDKQAAEYLRSLPPHRRQPGGLDEEIAAHVIWLVENHKFEPGHRFLVDGESNELHQSMTVMSGLRSTVCHWLMAYLIDPRKVDHASKGSILVKDGLLHVTVQGVAKHWDIYPEVNEEGPQAGPLSKALAGLSRRQTQLSMNGKRVKFWVINEDNLIAWADENGYPDPKDYLVSKEEQDKKEMS